MKKLVYEFSQGEFHPYKEFWQNHLPEEFAKLDLVLQNLSEEQIQKAWKSLLSKPDGALMSLAQSAIFFRALGKLPRRILESHMVDGIIRDKHKNWWPNCLYRDALHELIVRKVPNLDTEHIAYVVGSDHLMRVAVSVVIQLGFQGINIVIDDKAAREGVLENLERTYFDVDIRLIQSSELTLQKNNGTILVNTRSLEGQDELSEDLSYLNFILSDGLVVDTSLFPIKNHLLDEAEHVGLSIISGAELIALRDWQFLNALFGKVSLSPLQYSEQWIDFLQKSGKQKNPAEGPVTN